MLVSHAPNRVRKKRLTALPADHRQVFNIRRPGQNVLSLAKFLELHGKLALADLILREDLQVAGKTELGAHPDEPLGRVVLVPPNSVTIIHRELVVEIVVTLSNGDQCGDEMVARSVLVIKWCLAEPVSQ